MKRSAPYRSATAHLCWAICGAVCLGGPALSSQQMDDLIVDLQPDGGCYRLCIHNVLAAAQVVSELTIPGDIPVTLIVAHNIGSDLSEDITVRVPDEYFADPEEFVLADDASQTVLICQRVGA